MRTPFTSTGRSSRLCCLVGLSLTLLFAVAAQAAPETRPDAETAIDFDKLLGGPNLTPEQEAHRRKLEGILDAARDPLDRAAAHAALANWLLAVPTARPATKWVLGVENSEDRHILTEYAATASEQLTEARTLLKAVADSSAENVKTRGRQLTAGIENLDAFASVFMAVGEQGDETARKERWSSAAVGLAGGRESDQLRLASAATLWQSIAWEKAGRRERALMTLPDALAKPDQPYDFISRILRCRIISDGQQFAVAFALTLQIRARVDDWFPRERAASHQAKQRLAGLLQLKIGQAWLEQLRTATQPAQKGLEDILREVRSSVLPENGDSPEIFVLKEAIPILIEPPAVQPPAPEPDEQSVTGPAESATRPEQ